MLFAKAFQRNRVRLLDLLLGAPCIPLPQSQLYSPARLPVAPACGVNRITTTLRLKERCEPAKWLNAFLLAEPCIVELARPTFMYWALFMSMSDMPHTPEAIALLGQRTRASLQFVVERGADVNAVATLRCFSFRAPPSMRNVRTTMIDLWCRKQCFIKAQGQETLKPLIDYLQGITDMLRERGALGAHELPPPAATP